MTKQAQKKNLTHSSLAVSKRPVRSCRNLTSKKIEPLQEATKTTTRPMPQKRRAPVPKAQEVEVHS